MKKILLGVLAITMTVGLVSGSAYALFSDTEEVQGIAISAGNANLTVWDGTGYEDNAVLNMNFDAIYPGWRSGQRLTVRNDSLSEIGLDITGQLTGFEEPNTNGIEDWNVMKNNVQLAVVKYETAADAQAAIDAEDPSNGGVNQGGTGWHTLRDWRNNVYDMTDDAVEQNARGFFVVWVQVDTEVDNEIAQAELQNIELTLVGTQAN